MNIDKYKCAHCGFSFPMGWGGYLYAIADDGTRVPCPHPLEPIRITEVTGMSWRDAQSAGRLGDFSHCVCLDCVAQFDLDVQRDQRICPKCSSTRVHSADEMVGKECPRCNTGKIERLRTGFMA